MLEIALGVLFVVVLATMGGALLVYRRRVRRLRRQNSWRELCLRLELVPQPGAARVATGELAETRFVLHDTGSQWLVELPLAQPLLPPGMLLLSPDAASLPPPLRLSSLEWASGSTPPGIRAWSVEGEEQERSGKVEAPQAFLDVAARAMQAHAPLRVESRRIIQALRVGDLLSVSRARDAVRALADTTRGWLEVAAHVGLPQVQELPQPQPAVDVPGSSEVPASPPEPESQGLLPPEHVPAQRHSSSELVVDFNALPRVTRERFVAATGSRPEVPPILADRRFRGGIPWTPGVAGIGAVTLFGLIQMVRADFGRPGMHEEHWAAITLYVGAVFFVLAAVLILVFQGRWKRTLPFHPGRYVLPSDFVDATTRRLRIVPLSAPADIDRWDHDIRGRNGRRRYSHTTLALRFNGRSEIERFIFYNKTLADAHYRHLRQVCKAYVTGTAPRGAHTDPFFEARHQPGGLEALRDKSPGEDSSGGPLAQELPKRLRPSFLFPLAFGVSLVLGPGMWLVRNHLSDAAAFEAAQKDRGGEALQWYAALGGRRASEARWLGEQRSFEACEQQDTTECWSQFLGLWPTSPRSEEVLREREPRAALKTTPHTVAGLREFLRRYPNSVVAAEVREQLLPAAEFQAVPLHSVPELRRFRNGHPRSEAAAQAQARLHELIVAAQAELLHQASPQHPEVTQFMSQLLTSLETSETSLVPVNFRRQIAPSLRSSVGASSVERLEGHTVRRLEDAFEQIFSAGMVTLVHEESLPEQEGDADVKSPRIDITYAIDAPGVTYQWGRGGRQFAGLQFDFDVALRMPGMQPVRFRLQVKPPRDFPLDASGPEPGDSAVSSAMAQRAFDELRGKLGTVFFRADSKAFQALSRPPMWSR